MIIIAEIGINHNGSIELAHELIRQAKICGADIAKFQFYDPYKIFGPLGSFPNAEALAQALTVQFGFEEARHALLGSTVLQRKPGVVTFDELGPYKYLLRMSLDADVRDSYREAVAKLADYDRERSTSLLLTLEEFLRRRGNISATSEALFVHPNTLRQRLRRISELCGLDLRTDDWLMIEIAVKLVRLKQTLERDGANTSGALRV